MDEAITPFSKKTWSEIVFEKLRQLIEDEFWKPKEKIYTEAELCEKFNVSRSTVREAINMLKANGLVYAVPGVGTFVREREEAQIFDSGYRLDIYSEKSLLDVMEYRVGIEPFNAALAASRLSDAEVAELARMHRQDVEAPESHPKFIAKSDMAFHMHIAKATKNDIVVNAMSNIKGYLLKQQIATSYSPRHRPVDVEFHARIVDAIEKRDSELAEKAMRDHMSETYHFIQSIIDSAKKMKDGGRSSIRIL